MDSMLEFEKYSAEGCREEGKRLLFGSGHTSEEREMGLKLIDRAAKWKDPEASYIIGMLLVTGQLKAMAADSVECGLLMVCRAANRGFAPARTFLNRYCDTNYQNSVASKFKPSVNGPLTGFDGKRIKLNRRGLLTPVDAELKYENGINILTLQANVVFEGEDEEMSDPALYRKAVLDGFRAWAGEYEVFGGQKIKVVVELTTGGQAFDSVYVLSMSNEMHTAVFDICNRIGTEKAKERANNLFGTRRSLTAIGFRRWSVNSRKLIVMQCEDGRFDDYEELMHVAKHEFGHALGLGDLYESAVDGLSGVEKGSYQETDSYYIFDNFYNLVMCDHHGPISNNDIEMIVLAFSKNKLQKYQPQKFKGKISEALGKGN